MTGVVHLFSEFGPTPPEWLHLLPAGTFSGVDGRGPYTADARAIIAASMGPGKLPIDQDHATDLAAPNGGPAPARGWIVELQARGNGVWGRVEWTPTGQQLIAERAYRGISPVFTADRADGGTIHRLLRASLTNTPNLSVTSLHSTDRAQDDIRAAIFKRLGLPSEDVAKYGND